MTTIFTIFFTLIVISSLLFLIITATVMIADCLAALAEEYNHLNLAMKLYDYSEFWWKFLSKIL